jgi:hypothetical protein
MIEGNPVLNKQLMVTGTSTSRYGKEFASMVEFRKYPIYLFQFHMEKFQYERRRITDHLHRDYKMIRFCFKFMQHFVEDLRKGAIHPINLPKDVVSYSARNFALETPDVEEFEQVHFVHRFTRDLFVQRTFE